MKIALALPTAIPGVTAREVRAWAEAVEAGPFATLCAIERLCHPTWDPLITLAGVATLTQRVRLMTTLLLGPLRPTGLLVQAAASLDQLSGGRLSLGLGIGGRAGDYAAAPASFGDRGRRFDAQLAALHAHWGRRSSSAQSPAQDDIGPQPIQAGGPELLVGGHAPRALARAGQWGDGYLAGSVGPYVARRAYAAVEAAWQAAHRPGKPRFVSLVWFALGDDADARARAYLLDYFAELGTDAAARVQAAHIVTSSAQIQQALDDYHAVGLDELVFLPCARALDQIHKLADNMHHHGAFIDA